MADAKDAKDLAPVQEREDNRRPWHVRIAAETRGNLRHGMVISIDENHTSVVQHPLGHGPRDGDPTAPTQSHREAKACTNGKETRCPERHRPPTRSVKAPGCLDGGKVQQQGQTSRTGHKGGRPEDCGMQARRDALPHHQARRPHDCGQVCPGNWCATAPNGRIPDAWAPHPELVITPTVCHCSDVTVSHYRSDPRDLGHFATPRALIESQCHG